jgi:hypothetical protein
LQKLQVAVAVVMIMWWRHFVDPGVIWMLQEVQNVVSCLMKFLRKTKTLQQQQQQQQEQQQQAGKQAATVATPLLSSAAPSESNAPPLPRTRLTNTATGIAPAAAAAPTPSPHAAASLLAVRWAGLRRLRRSTCRKRCLFLFSLTLHAAVACPIFDPRAAHVHNLQPLALLGIRPSQRVRAAAMCVWRSDGFGTEWNALLRQRLQLLRCGCMLGTVAARLSLFSERWGGSKFPVLILRHCFSMNGFNHLLRLLDALDKRRQ